MLTVQPDKAEEKEDKVDGHDTVLAGVQYAKLAEREEAAEAAQDTMQQMHQVWFQCIPYSSTKDLWHSCQIWSLCCLSIFA